MSSGVQKLKQTAHELYQANDGAFHRPHEVEAPGAMLLGSGEAPEL